MVFSMTTNDRNSTRIDDAKKLPAKPATGTPLIPDDLMHARPLRVFILELARHPENQKIWIDIKIWHQHLAHIRTR